MLCGWHQVARGVGINVLQLLQQIIKFALASQNASVYRTLTDERVELLTLVQCRIAFRHALHNERICPLRVNAGSVVV